MGGLRIVTYNYREIKSSLPVIHELCTDNDIVQLQETLLCSHNVHFINSLHSDFYGGLCIMWRKSLGSFVTLKQYTERIIGVEVTGSTILLLLNVYLPYDNNT